MERVNLSMERFNSIILFFIDISSGATHKLTKISKTCACKALLTSRLTAKSGVSEEEVILMLMPEASLMVIKEFK